MSHASHDILLTSPNREILVWRRIGGGNPGYGLDVDGTTTQFVSKGLTKLRADAHALATARGLTLAKPELIRTPITGSAGQTHTDPELAGLLGRFYIDGAVYGWDEPMIPTGKGS